MSAPTGSDGADGRGTAPEWRFLRQAISRTENPDPADEVDYERVVELATAHSVLGHLGEGLSDVGIPDPPASMLATRRTEHASRALHLAGTLCDILETFDAADLRALPYKGPILSTIAYGDVGRRQYVDLDVLVAPDAFEDACTLLEDEGYEEVDRLEGLGEVVFARDSVSVDLHRHILPRYFPATLPFEEAWERRSTVELNGRSVPALDPADRLAVLAVHGTKHCWYKLAWVCDIAALVRDDHVSWSAAWARAGELRCRRQLLLGYWLANQLLGTSLDPAISERIGADPTVRRLGERSLSDLREPPVTAPSDRTQFEFGWRALSRRRDRILFAVRVATIPSADDLESVSLPEPMAPFYRVVRPARLAARAGRMAASRLLDSPSGGR